MPYVVACVGGFLRKGSSYNSKLTRRVVDLDHATVFSRRSDALLACYAAQESGIAAIEPKEVCITLCCTESAHA